MLISAIASLVPWLLSSAAIAQGARSREPEEVVILLVGSAGAPGDELNALAQSALTACQAQGCDLGLLLGDNVGRWGARAVTDEGWQAAFLRPWGGFSAIPGFHFYAAMGDRDWRSGYRGALAQVQFTSSPDNPKAADGRGLWQMPAVNYAIPQPLPAWVRLTVIDTPSLLRSGNGRGDTLAQLQDLKIGESFAGWNIVAGHDATMSQGEESEGLGKRRAARMQRRLAEWEDVDLVLSGSDYIQEILYGGDYVQVIQGNSAESRCVEETDYTARSVWSRGSRNTQAKCRTGNSIPSHGFSILELTEAQMTLTFYDKNGDVLRKVSAALAGNKAQAPAVLPP